MCCLYVVLSAQSHAVVEMLNISSFKCNKLIFISCSEHNYMVFLIHVCIVNFTKSNLTFTNFWQHLVHIFFPNFQISKFSLVLLHVLFMTMFFFYFYTVDCILRFLICKHWQYYIRLLLSTFWMLVRHFSIQIEIFQICDLVRF